MVLSNRDKSRHTDQRGLDSKTVQTEQYQDHSANRQIDIELTDDGNTSGFASSMTDESGEQSSLKSRSS
ncbi:hypothetical protein CS379_09330 [Methylobacterium frigidaeris]|nr:hypothetical protein CS379_09330 [Methylobacterium frigidaeris]